MIYLDYNATSPLHPEVRRAMAPFLEDRFGNASSMHGVGRQARSAVEEVRGRILSFLGDPTGTLIFTSGGTEADNLGIQGIARAYRKGDKNHLVVSSVEHHAVLHAAEALREEGFELTLAPVDSSGVVDLKELEKTLTPRTILLSVMHANNEVGAVQPIGQIARIARQRQVIFHTDAVQSFGKLPLAPKAVGVDSVSLSGHKLGGPKGVGALYLRKGLKVKSLLYGGPHEHSHRAGTEGVPGIVGLGAAAEVTFRHREQGFLRQVERLRDRLQAGILEAVSGVKVNTHPTERLPGALNVSFLGCSGETLLMSLDLEGICVSTGSACSSGSMEPSHVLVAMGLPEAQIAGSIRFSLGWGTTEEEVDQVLERLPRVVERVRAIEKVT